MRWSACFILAYLLLGVQLGLGDYAQIRGASPDLALIAVVFICLNAPRVEALLACFMLGALQDLLTLQPMGLYAFSYGMVALMLTPLAPLMRRGHPLTQFAVTVVGGTITAILILLNGWLHPVEPASVQAGMLVPAVRLSPRLVLMGVVVYPAILAPLVLGVLQRLQEVFGFKAQSRRRGF